MHGSCLRIANCSSGRHRTQPVGICNRPCAARRLPAAGSVGRIRRGSGIITWWSFSANGSTIVATSRLRLVSREAASFQRWVETLSTVEIPLRGFLAAQSSVREAPVVNAFCAGDLGGRGRIFFAASGVDWGRLIVRIIQPRSVTGVNMICPASGCKLGDVVHVLPCLRDQPA